MGSELVDWLLGVGLAADRSLAVNLGSKLLQGRVIEHVDQEQYFHDTAYLYRFTDRLPCMTEEDEVNISV